MALVWRARHQRLGHTVAVKFLRNPDDQKLRDRFLREAQVAAAIRHRNVVEILDVGEEGDHVYIVMELLDGESLADHLARGPLPVADGVRLAAAILGGLTAVHEAGIVHRDLKPENVLLVQDADGLYPKIVDFGISKVHLGSEAPAARESSPRLVSVVPTQENVLVGTPEYMSPEQVRAKAHVDQRSDVWSIGVILYEMFAGDVPFRGETAADVFIAIATEQEPELAALRPDMPEPLARFVQRALRKAPEERYTNARAMRRALVQAVGEAARDTELAGDPDQAQALRGALGASYEPGDSLVMKLPSTRGPRPEQPTLDFDESPASAPRPRRVVWGVGAASVVVALGVVAWTFGAAAPAAETAAAPSEAPAPEVLAAAPEPPAVVAEPAAPRTVRIELLEVPSGAEIHVDGRPQASATFELPAREEPRLIEVRAPGHREWRVEQVFTADAQLTPNMPRRGRAAARGTTMASMSTASSERPTYFRDPGF